MKVLFLDIDGVLNTPAAECGYRLAMSIDRTQMPRFKDLSLKERLTNQWCPASLYNLYRIVEKTGCKIVISSSWRGDKTVEEMQKWFHCDLLKHAVIGRTPHVFNKTGEIQADGYPSLERVQRGVEISTWLKNCNLPIENFAIVDDDSDMLGVENNFFKTDGYIGLHWRIADEIIEFLNKGEKNESK